MTDRKPVFDAFRAYMGGSIDQIQTDALDQFLDGFKQSQAKHALADEAAFFAAMRKVTGPLNQSQVDTVNALIAGAAHWPIGWLAYGLATAWHEARLMPIRELGGPSYYFRMYDIEGKRPSVARALGNTFPGDGAKFAGRGLVQLTGRTNYARAGAYLGLDLIAQPDLALEPANAARILIWGMETGAFTGKAMKDCIGTRGTPAEFRQARKIINGTDRDVMIAGYADGFQTALDKGKWT